MPSPQSLLKDAVAGAVVALFAVSFYISSASLAFQGPLAPWLPGAIGAAILGGGLLSLLTTWRSSLTRAAAGPEPGAVPVLASLAAATAAQSAPDSLLANTVMALALATLLIGATWWAIGRRGAGNLVRYIPYPVIGGFLASAGWLMLTGGLGVSAATPLTPAVAARWLHGEFDPRLLAGAAIAVAMFAGSLRIRHVLFLPLAIVALVLGVHALLRLAGLDVDAARAAGWLMQRFERALPPLPAAPALLAQVQWDVVAAQAALFLTFVIIGTVSLLLSIGSVEVSFDEEAQVNADLRLFGLGNVVVGVLGGLAGGISVSRSIMNRAAGATGAWSGAFNGALCLLAIGWGGPLIALLPRPLIGGLLAFLGLGLLKAWLWDSAKRLPRRDLATIVAMVIATAAFGLLPAVCIGVLACCVDLAISSARLPPVRRQLPRSAWPSRVEYGEAQAERLRAAGAALRIVELQGVLFFGSVTRLAEQLERELNDASARPRELLLDFAHVPAVDTSAAQGLMRLLKLAARLRIAIGVSGLAPSVHAALAAGGVLGAPGLRANADVDAAVRDWDDRVLADADTAPGIDWLRGGGEAAAALLGRFETLTLAPGDVLFEQGDAPDALYVVAEGRLVATVTRDGRSVEVRTVHAGSAVGEMGLFRAIPRSATLRAASPTRVLRLTRDAIEALDAQAPQQALALYRVLLRQLAARLDQASAQANALSG